MKAEVEDALVLQVNVQSNAHSPRHGKDRLMFRNVFDRTNLIRPAEGIRGERLMVKNDLRVDMGKLARDRR